MKFARACKRSCEASRSRLLTTGGAIHRSDTRFREKPPEHFLWGLLPQFTPHRFHPRLNYELSNDRVVPRIIFLNRRQKDLRPVHNSGRDPFRSVEWFELKRLWSIVHYSVANVGIAPSDRFGLLNLSNESATTMRAKVPAVPHSLPRRSTISAVTAARSVGIKCRVGQETSSRQAISARPASSLEVELNSPR